MPTYLSLSVSLLPWLIGLSVSTSPLIPSLYCLAVFLVYYYNAGDGDEIDLSLQWIYCLSGVLSALLYVHYIRWMIVLILLTFAHFAWWRWILPIPSGVTPHMESGWLGSARALVENKHRLSQWISQGCKQMGGDSTWVFYVPFQPPTYVIHNPKLVQEVMGTQNMDKYHRYDPMGYLDELIGGGIVMANGVEWAHQRSSASRFFTPKRIQEQMLPIFTRRAKELRKFIDGLPKGSNFDLQRLLTSTTLRTFIEIAFGLEAPPNEEFNELSQAFDTAIHASLERYGQFPLWVTITRHLPGLNPNEQRLQRALKVIDQYIYRMIDRPATDNTLLAYYLATDPMLSKKQLRDFILTFMFAGRDSTATSTTWCMTGLSRYPQLWRDEDAEKDALEIVRGRGPIYGWIRETLRLHPPLPMNMKTSKVHQKLSDGTVLEPGDQVMIPIYHLGRRVHNSEVFAPSRWTTPGVPEPSSYEIPTFNCGPRVCLGQQMALVQIVAFLRELKDCSIQFNDTYNKPVGIHILIPDGMMFVKL